MLFVIRELFLRTFLCTLNRNRLIIFSYNLSPCFLLL
nr:MAG TPA_asm: hypothetical protein [Caudoviricetes sp.]